MRRVAKFMTMCYQGARRVWRAATRCSQHATKVRVEWRTVGTHCAIAFRRQLCYLLWTSCLDCAGFRAMQRLVISTCGLEPSLREVGTSRFLRPLDMWLGHLGIRIRRLDEFLAATRCAPALLSCGLGPRAFVDRNALAASLVAPRSLLTTSSSTIKWIVKAARRDMGRQNGCQHFPKPRGGISPRKQAFEQKKRWGANEVVSSATPACGNRFPWISTTLTTATVGVTFPTLVGITFQRQRIITCPPIPMSIRDALKAVLFFGALNRVLAVVCGELSIYTSECRA
jgi:hypothetical protein